MADQDAQSKLMQSVWRKAFLQGEVVLKLPSKSDLTNLRFKLYNTSKLVKRDPAKHDLDLQNAVENCSIRISDQGGFTLTVYRQDKNLLLQSVAAQLGETIETPLPSTAMTGDISSSLASIMGKIGGGEDEARDVKPRMELPYPLRNPPANSEG